MLKVVKKWFSDIADLRQKHKLVIVMRDNPGENKSQEIIDFFESVGVTNYWTGRSILVQGSIGCM